jgi:hypothetical protein
MIIGIELALQIQRLYAPRRDRVQANKGTKLRGEAHDGGKPGARGQTRAGQTNPKEASFIKDLESTRQGDGIILNTILAFSAARG